MYCNPSEPPPVETAGLPALAPGNLLLQHPRRTRVSFHDTRIEMRVVSLACLSDELRRDIWYSPADIETMRTEARDLCRFLRVNPRACPEEHTRGLELRISLERQCRKQMTVQGVVEAQRRCTDPAFLASLAQRCSLLPKEMALAQAQKDYCTVYVNGPSSFGVSSRPSQMMDQSGNVPYHMMNMNPTNMMESFMPSMHPGPPPPMAAAAQTHFHQQEYASAYAHAQPMQQQQQQQQQQSFEEDFSDSLEPIPLSDSDQSLIFLQNNKRALMLCADTQERMVRQRMEGYPAA